MKKLISLSLIIVSGVSFSQVAIGKITVEEGALLDFSSDAKGIVLPVVEELPTAGVNGTILMDGKSDQLKVKVYENDVWVELSDTGSISTEVSSGANVTTAVVGNSSTEVGNGVVITDNASSGNVSSAVGVLVLESTSKALVLPKVANPHLNIKSPRAGTICYDTTSDSLAVFDGKVWNYWK